MVQGERGERGGTQVDVGIILSRVVTMRPLTRTSSLPEAALACTSSPSLLLQPWDGRKAPHLRLRFSRRGRLPWEQ